MMIGLYISVAAVAPLPCDLATNKPAKWVDVGPAGTYRREPVLEPCDLDS